MKPLPRAVPVPDRMLSLPRDPRGYCVPVTVFRDSAGRPHFTINDEEKRQAVLALDCCPICAGKLVRGRWFVGGPASAFHAHGAYIDPPMHRECAVYALSVCPYLAAPSYGRRIDDRTLPPGEVPLLVDPTMDAVRPPVFVAGMATGQRFVFDEMVGLRFVRFVRPRRPFARVEFWKDGQPVPAEWARQLLPVDLVEAST